MGDRAVAHYPLDHRSGYCPVPRDVRVFEPLMRDSNGILMRLWVLLYARARHKAGWVRGSHGNVHLEQGQCTCGVREVGAALGVGKNTAERALAELERLGLITREAGQRGLVVSVVNYGSFGESDGDAEDSVGDTLRDSRGDSSGTASGTAPGQPRGHHRGTKERRNRKNRGTGNLPPSGPDGAVLREGEAEKTEELSGVGKTPTAAVDVAKPPTSDHARAKARWFELYAGRYGGTKPTWAGEQARQLKELLDQHGCDAVVARMERLMTDPPDWLSDEDGKGSFSFRTLRGNFDSLAVRSAEAGRSQEDRRRIEERRRRLEMGPVFEDWNLTPKDTSAPGGETPP